MALSIRDLETERLAAEVAVMTGDTKTGAVRQALRERRERLRGEEREAAAASPGAEPTEAWVLIPASAVGRLYADR